MLGEMRIRTKARKHALNKEEILHLRKQSE